MLDCCEMKYYIYCTKKYTLSAKHIIGSNGMRVTAIPVICFAGDMFQRIDCIALTLSYRIASERAYYMKIPQWSVAALVFLYAL